MAVVPAQVVSFRQACMNLCEGAGIVGCRVTKWWWTADEYAQDEEDHGPLGADMRAVRMLGEERFVPQDLVPTRLQLHR